MGKAKIVTKGKIDTKCNPESAKRLSSLFQAIFGDDGEMEEEFGTGKVHKMALMWIQKMKTYSQSSVPDARRAQKDSGSS